jgi:hypothetical protein
MQTALTEFDKNDDFIRNSGYDLLKYLSWIALLEIMPPLLLQLVAI